ncbi:helix-turn-helix domain-containing protein [Rhodopirellula baltica]|uniref:helix-turn-helix domain-containing protein n=1 Tax=Rhodopirellula baltica TaxID=265606 RepID=UPI001F46DC79|nr:helix-turn-helix domain-containing protein [Rhodopirellula baltica]
MQRHGKKQKEIAEEIGDSPSTVSHELARNQVTGKHYHPLHAERRANPPKKLSARNTSRIVNLNCANICLPLCSMNCPSSPPGIAQCLPSRINKVASL